MKKNRLMNVTKYIINLLFYKLIFDCVLQILLGKVPDQPCELHFVNLGFF